MMKPVMRHRAGVTLVETLCGASLFVMTIVALLSAFFSQTDMNEHARNRSWAALDVMRILERLQFQNSEGLCTAVNVAPPAGYASWDAWLGDAGPAGGGGKNVPPNSSTSELVVVNPPLGTDPVEVTVTVCWRHRRRVIGECIWDGAQLVANDANGDGVITSPVSYSTMVTCRG